MFFRVSPSLSSRYFRSVTLHCRFKARELFLFRKTRGTRNANKNIRAALRGGEGEGGGGKSCRAYIIKFSGGNADYWFDYRFDYIWLRPLAARARASVINQPSGSGKKRRKGTSVCRCCRSSRRISFRPLFFEKFFERINKESKEKQNTKRGWTKWKLFLQRSSRIGNILENENLWWRVSWMLFKDDSSNKPSLLIFNLARRLASRASSSRLFIPAGGGEKKKGKKLWCS